MSVAAMKPVVKQAQNDSPIDEAALQELLGDIKNRRAEFKNCLLYTSPSPRD